MRLKQIKALLRRIDSDYLVVDAFAIAATAVAAVTGLAVLMAPKNGLTFALTEVIGSGFVVLLALRSRGRWRREVEPPPPPTVRERLDALAEVMSRASGDLRTIAERVEAETAKITAELDGQLAQAETEVRARQAKLDELVARSKQFEQTAAMNQEQAEAVARFFRLQVEEVTEKVERSTRRREWGLATVGGFTVGILTIVAAKLFLGF